MSRLANHLKRHLDGTSSSTKSTLEAYSAAGGPYRLAPQLVVSPRTVDDVSTVLTFVNDLARKGHPMPITARGAGTDFSGSSLGSGIILNFEAYMNRVTSYDSRRAAIAVEPGALVAKINQALNVNYQWLTGTSLGEAYSTIGAEVANNSAGPYALKYGPLAKDVKSLQVVLANGDVITTERLTARQLAKKESQKTQEAAIYRKVHALITANKALINKVQPGGIGYRLSEVMDKKGHFDLTQLFIGSQGTLGVITEANLKAYSHNVNTSVAMVLCKDSAVMTKVVKESNELEPAAIEMMDKASLVAVLHEMPSYFKDIISGEMPEYALLIEFDDSVKTKRKRKQKKLLKLCNSLKTEILYAETHVDREQLWSVRQGVSHLLNPHTDNIYIPVFGEVKTDPSNYLQAIQLARDIGGHNGLQTLCWGSIGQGILDAGVLVPRGALDPELERRMKSDFIRSGRVLKLEHSPTRNQGRTLAGRDAEILGTEMARLNVKVKHIFDPYNILNPGVKASRTVCPPDVSWSRMVPERLLQYNPWF